MPQPRRTRRSRRTDFGGGAKNLPPRVRHTPRSDHPSPFLPSLASRLWHASVSVPRALRGAHPSPFLPSLRGGCSLPFFVSFVTFVVSIRRLSCCPLPSLCGKHPVPQLMSFVVDATRHPSEGTSFDAPHPPRPVAERRRRGRAPARCVAGPPRRRGLRAARAFHAARRASPLRRHVARARGVGLVCQSLVRTAVAEEARLAARGACQVRSQPHPARPDSPLERARRPGTP